MEGRLKHALIKTIQNGADPLSKNPKLIQKTPSFQTIKCDEGNIHISGIADGKINIEKISRSAKAAGILAQTFSIQNDSTNKSSNQFENKTVFTKLTDTPKPKGEIAIIPASLTSIAGYP